LLNKLQSDAGIVHNFHLEMNADLFCICKACQHTQHSFYSVIYSHWKHS